MEENKVLFQGELQLTAWGESSTTGAWVKFWVHPDDLESFKLLRTRVGKVAGQRIGTAMVEIGEDEAVVSHAPAPRPTPGPTEAPQPRGYRAPHITGLAMLAVRWCQDPEFWLWASDHYVGPGSAGRFPGYKGRVEGEGAAKDFILEVCGDIKSRKVLAEDGEPARLFNERIRQPFMAWRASQ